MEHRYTCVTTLIKYLKEMLSWFQIRVLEEQFHAHSLPGYILNTYIIHSFNINVYLDTSKTLSIVKMNYVGQREYFNSKIKTSFFANMLKKKYNNNFQDIMFAELFAIRIFFFFFR